MDYIFVRVFYLINIFFFDFFYIFILKLGMIDFWIKIIVYNGSTFFYFFFYDFIYLKCLFVSVEKVFRGLNERVLKGF